MSLHALATAAAWLPEKETVVPSVGSTLLGCPVLRLSASYWEPTEASPRGHWSRGTRTVGSAHLSGKFLVFFHSVTLSINPVDGGAW